MEGSLRLWKEYGQTCTPALKGAPCTAILCLLPDLEPPRPEGRIPGPGAPEG